jgi:HK97 family phage prohead protease
VIDWQVGALECKPVLGHEVKETNTLIENPDMDYDTAHEQYANPFEQQIRQNPDKADELLRAEFDKLLSLITKGVRSKAMKETVYKTFRPEVKAVDVEEGTIDMFIPMSTGAMDLSKEVILPSSWDNEYLTAFMKRPVMVSSHDYSDLRKQIGEWLQLTVTDTGLFAKPKYYINQGNEEADWAFNLASKGMAAFSVGFNPIEYKIGKGKNDPAITYTKNQLLEISHVIVPCNQDAMMAMRGKSVDPVLNQLIDDIVNADSMEMLKATPGKILALKLDAEITGKKPRSQAEIKDELDYIATMLKEIESFDEENQAIAKTLIESMGNFITQEITRTPGGDMPVEDRSEIIQIAQIIGAEIAKH